MNVAELFVKSALMWGARHCFMVTGGMAMYLNKAISEESGIRTTFVHHEQAAICAAEGWTKSTGFKSIGLACVTAGPGVTNSITGLVAAYGDSVPILILAGQVKTQDINTLGLRTHGIQEVNSKSLVTPAVKKFVRIEIEKLLEQLREVKEALLSGRKGPVFVEIPLDIQSMEVPLKVIRSLNEITTTDVDKTELKLCTLVKTLENLTLLNQRIGVVIGNGLRISGVNYAELFAILKSRNIPIFFTWLSFDLYGFNEENNMGCPGGFASTHSNLTLQECDFVVFLGARIDLATSAFQRGKYGARGSRLFIDIDQKELDKFTRKSDYKFCIDLKDCFEEIKSIFAVTTVDEDWAKEIVVRKKDSLLKEEEKLATEELSVRNVALAVSKYLNHGVVVSASSGVAEEIFTRFLRPNGIFRFFNSAALGAMGQGLSHGIGSAIQRVDDQTPVLIFEGDGGLWMHVHELATVAQEKLKNFHLFVLNNKGYASIRNSQMNHFKYRFGCDSDSGLFIPNYSQIASIFGFRYIEVTKPQELSEDFFSRIFTNQGCNLIDLKLSLVEEVGPKLKTILKDGRPTTEDFGDLGW